MPKQRRAAPNAQPASVTFKPPYPPSWFDRLTLWVDHLPGPAWVYYVILGAAFALAESAIQWGEGAYPAGTFNALHVWTASNFAFLLCLMHYLDKSAASALASFRPLLASAGNMKRQSSEDESSYASLAYQLTTLHPRPALIATIAGAAFAISVHVLLTANGIVPSYLAGTAGSQLSTVSAATMLTLGNALSGLLAYHTIHQLALVSRIYTRHAHISIYQLQHLYALSRPGALTGIGIILFIYTWFATSGAGGLGPIEVALSLSMATIAGATFTLPLIGAHRRLAAEKSRRLAEASSRFEAATEDLHKLLDGEPVRGIDDPYKAIASLETEQVALRRISTWPWEPGAVRGLVAAFLLPVAVWGIQQLLGRLLAR
jgi:hypothetical protein